MAKSIIWGTGTPTDASMAGQGDEELDSIKTYVSDEHSLDGATNDLIHDLNSARANYAAALPAHDEQGRLNFRSDEAMFYVAKGGGDWIPLATSNWKFAQVTGDGAAVNIPLLAPYTDIELLSIGAYSVAAGLTYHISFMVIIEATALYAKLRAEHNGVAVPGEIYVHDDSSGKHLITGQIVWQPGGAAVGDLKLQWTADTAPIVGTPKMRNLIVRPVPYTTIAP